MAPASLVMVLALLATALPGGAGAQDGASKPAPPVSSTRSSPGWVPSFDPESSAVTLGRRTNAPLVSMRFRGGARSLDALGRALCRYIHHSDRDSMMALTVTDDEFRDILWREFPQSRPATGLQWEDGWRMLYVRLLSGCQGAVRDYGTRHWEFVRFEVGSVVPYKNFQLHNGLVMLVRDDEGQIQRWGWLRSVAERKGVFKIYSTGD
jgi:hypothetical protein